MGGLLTGVHLVRRLGTTGIYTDDFAQDYAADRAISVGRVPYELSASALIRTYIPESAGRVMDAPYPMLHPPLAGLLVLPLTGGSYATARALWLGFEILCLVILVALRLDDPGRWRQNLALSIALLSWPPVALELRFGQWSLLLAVLSVLAWWTFRRGWPACAGVLLGLAIGVKVFPVLLLGFFALRRAWRTVAWALGTAAALTLASAVLVPGLLVGYLHAVGQAPAELALFANYSALGAMDRLVTTAGDLGGVPATLVAPEWAPVLCGVTSGLLLLATGLAMARALAHERDDLAFAMALCATTLLTPLVWQYYLCLLLWPLGVVATELYHQHWPRAASRIFLVAVLLLSFPQQLVSMLAVAAAAIWSPTGAVVLLLLPAGPLTLLYLLRRQAFA